MSSAAMRCSCNFAEKGDRRQISRQRTVARIKKSRFRFIARNRLFQFGSVERLKAAAAASVFKRARNYGQT
jgi:hypothetical protein